MSPREEYEYNRGYEAGLFAAAYSDTLDPDHTAKYQEGFVDGWVAASTDEHFSSDDEVLEYWKACGMPEVDF